MEYRYSEEVDRSFYEDDGLGHDIPLRLHKDLFKEIRGTIRAQRDWSKNVSPVKGYKGGLGHPYSFMTVTVPECLPERLEVISYANEYAFLYDDQPARFLDEFENIEFKNYSGGFPGILETFSGDPLDKSISSKVRPEKRLLAQIYSEMASIDPIRAKTTLKAWATFVQSAARTRSMPFGTLKEYIPARVVDAGQMIWYGTLTFGLALTIPEDEYELCHELAKPGYIAMALANDLYSWDKERAAAKEAGQDHVFNAIWVIMKESSVSEAEAKEICRVQIHDYITQYARIVEEAEADMTISEDLRKYIQAVRLSYSGNLVWSIYCPRYHDFQPQIIKRGVPVADDAVSLHE